MQATTLFQVDNNMKVIARIPLDEKTQIQQIPLFAETCYICRNEGEDSEMLVCDNCDYITAHLSCLRMRIVPTDAWFCEQCAR